MGSDAQTVSPNKDGFCSDVLCIVTAEEGEEADGKKTINAKGETYDSKQRTGTVVRALKQGECGYPDCLNLGGLRFSFRQTSV